MEVHQSSICASGGGNVFVRATQSWADGFPFKNAQLLTNFLNFPTNPRKLATFATSLQNAEAAPPPDPRKRKNGK